MEKLFTVDNIAEMTGLTTRTIRNYLADGRLKGRKIGSQWRFTEADIEALFSASEEADVNFKPTAELPDNIAEYLRRQQRDSVVICSVVDYPAPQEATDAVGRMLSESVTGYDGSGVTYSYEYLSDVSVGRFTLIGQIDAVAKLVKLIRKKG